MNRSTRLKTVLPATIHLLSRVRGLRLFHLCNLPLQNLVRHQPLRRIRIRAPRMNCVDARFQDDALLAYQNNAPTKYTSTNFIPALR